MKTNRSNQRAKQPTPKELTDDLLGFLQRKFYDGDPKCFAQDRSLLLAWAVLWPASWLNGKGVSLPTERYRQIFMAVFMDSIVHGTSKIKYRPAWLKQVIQSHFRIHGDEIYAEAKSARTLVENALALGCNAPVAARPDPIRELALAHALVLPSKRVKKPTAKEQLSLL
jgi:hypothetical protein